MSAAPQPIAFREARPTAAARDQAELLGELSRLFAIDDSNAVAPKLRPLVEELRACVRVCYRCQTEIVGLRKPKRRQRSFCSPECSAAQRHEDFIIRQNTSGA